MKGCVAREVGQASSLPVFGASCPKFPESRDDRTRTRGWKPREPAGGDACATMPNILRQGGERSASSGGDFGTCCGRGRYQMYHRDTFDMYFDSRYLQKSTFRDRGLGCKLLMARIFNCGMRIGNCGRRDVARHE